MYNDNGVKDFVILIVGSGEGCDYTIGCNRRWIFRQGKSAKSVLNKYVQESRDDDGAVCSFYGNEINIEKMTIIEINDKMEVDCQEIAEQLRSEKINKENVVLEEKEKAEYSRLKKKYDSK
jgi:hypothetical protein